MREPSSDCIVIMMRAPKMGKVKSRLSASVGNIHALELYRAFIQDTADSLAGIDADLIFSIYPPNSGIDPKGLPEMCSFMIDQSGEDLGEKQYGSLKEAYGMGYERSLVIASDCPEIDPSLVEKGFKGLDEYDVVLGPCHDGGYYLLGINRNELDPDIFLNIEWGTNGVLERFKKNLDDRGLSTFGLPYCHDIDDIDDLRAFWKRSRKGKNAPRTRKMISAMIDEGALRIER